MRIVVIGLLAVAAASLPLLAGQDPDKRESRTAWLRRIYATDRCRFGDGLRAVAGLVAGAPLDEPFAAIRKRVVDEGVMPDSWDALEESELTKGHLAYLLCGALKIKGGLTMRIVGITRRYALREAIYVGLIERGSTEEFVSGRELIDVTRRAEIYKAEGSLESIRKQP